MFKMKITVRRSGLVVNTLGLSNYRSVLEKFNKSISRFEKTREGNKTKWILKDKYCVDYLFSRNIGYHRNHLPLLLEHLKFSGIPENEIEVTYEEDSYTPYTWDANLKPGIKHRDHQVPILEWLSKRRELSTLPVQTSKGKTYMALMHIAYCGVRTVVNLRAQDIHNWIEKGVKRFFDISEKQYQVVEGKKGLIKMIEECRSGESEAGIYFISFDTFRNYMREYEQTGHSTYGVNPDKFYETCGVGLRVVDEAHLQTNYMYRAAINTSVMETVYLSGTIKSLDEFDNRLYEVLFPLESRYTGLDYHKYANVIGIGYNLDMGSIDKVPNFTRAGAYDHKVFEMWFLYNKRRLKNYIALIKDTVKKGYCRRYESGHRCLILVSRTILANKIANALKQDPELEHFTIKPFYRGIPDHVLHNSDIVVSTPGSAGTGKDIEQLTFMLNTVCVRSLEANLQHFGRLREIPHLNVTPTMAFLTCMDVPKQMEYSSIRTTIFKSHAKEFNLLVYPEKV